MRKYKNYLHWVEKLLSTPFYFLLLLIIHIMPANGQQTEHQSVVITDYLIYLPQDYNTNQEKAWPLMIYLHGAGLKDRSLKGLMDDYLPWHLEHDKVLPFIVVSPLCNTSGWNTTILNFLLDDLIVKYKVDKDKIYLTGHSMGGFGTWNWAVENPERFAAIVPVSGCCNSTDSISAWKLRNMPVWVFHGDMDKIVDIRCNIDMVKELEKFSKKVKFTVYPGRGHDTWEQTFSNDEMYEWLLAQDRKNNLPIAVQLDKKIYEAYTGLYLINNDTITLEYSGGQLCIKPREGSPINLISESERIFTFKENPSVSIIFQKENNKLTGFLIPGNGNMVARRIE